MVSETLWVPLMVRTSFSELRQKKEAAERGQLRVLTRFQVKTILSRIFLGRNLVRALRRQPGGTLTKSHPAEPASNQQATSNRQIFVPVHISSRPLPAICHLLPITSLSIAAILLPLCHWKAHFRITYLTLTDLPDPASPLFVTFSRS